MKTLQLLCVENTSGSNAIIQTITKISNNAWVKNYLVLKKFFFGLLISYVSGSLSWFLNKEITLFLNEAFDSIIINNN